MSDYASDRLAEVVAGLGCDLADGGRDWCGPCPVHGGDNRTALRLYADGHTRRGNWFCASHNCQEAFGRDLFGFVRGVLSHRDHGWSRPGDRVIGTGETLHWLASLFDVDPARLAEPGRERERSDEINGWTHRLSRLAAPPKPPPRGWSRERVRASLVIPSPYFLSRGFPAEILDAYDVGEPAGGGHSPMSGRAVVPVYDVPGERVVGFTGRATADGVLPKWRHDRFASGATLFNVWKAASEIRGTRRCVLVEGPGDCLRLVHAGCANAVATFGTRLTDAQQILIESLGCMELVPLYDFDGAGRAAVENLRRQAGRSFRVRVPDWRPASSKDVGGCGVGELRSLVEALR